MTADSERRLDQRVARAAQHALDDRGFVSMIDVLIGIGWLAPRRVDEWRQGRVAHLEAALPVAPTKVTAALAILDGWSRARGLDHSETAYVARTRARKPLRFSESGDRDLERAYRTHWFSPELSQRERSRLAERQSRPPELVVISPSRTGPAPPAAAAAIC